MVKTPMLQTLIKEKILKSRLVRFAIVGSVGFSIEALLLTYLSAYPAIGPIYGRMISFPIAVFATWAMNRKITFQSHNPPGIESLKYFVIQTFGALCNLCVFFILVSSFTALKQEPVLPLAIASALALPVNFILSRSWVYRSNG